MRRAKGSLLHRSLVLAGVAAFSVGLGGCVWDGGHHHRNRGWWGWDDGPRYDRYRYERHRHDRYWDRDRGDRKHFHYDRRGPAGRPRR
jgi:hypothetical protein